MQKLKCQITKTVFIIGSCFTLGLSIQVAMLIVNITQTIQILTNKIRGLQEECNILTAQKHVLCYSWQAEVVRILQLFFTSIY